MSMDLLDIVRSYMDTYPRMINEYFAGKRSEKELTDVTTQPFWYSMTLSKRRMDKKGITSEVELQLDKRIKNSPLTSVDQKNKVYNIDYMTWGVKQGYEEREDNIHESGMLVRKVMSQRTYKKDGRILYQKKDHEYCQLSILKSLVKDGKVSCPNCGYEAEASHFSDGCDSCGAHYTVNDFEPKVSGFSTDENVQDKIIKTLTQSYLRVVITIVVCFIIGALFEHLIFKAGKGLDFLFIHLNQGQMSIMFMLLLILGVLSVFIFNIVWIPLGIIRARYVKRYGTMYDNVDAVKNLYADFSPADFSQKLECKVKNIMLAENAQEIAPFSTLNLTSQLSRYADVIDCNLVSFHFENATNWRNNYTVSGAATLRLFEYKNNKITSRHEVLHVTMQGKKGVVDQPIHQIKEYKCPNCASSVNLLKGSVCEYCGSEFSFDDFDWMITRLDVGDKPKNVLTKVRILVPVVFLIFYLPVFYLLSIVAYSSGMESNVVFENDKVVYVNEEFFADKDTYADIEDLFYNNLLKDYYIMEKQLSVSTMSGDNNIELYFYADDTAKTIQELQTKWSDMGYTKTKTENGSVYFEKESVYLNYIEHSAIIRIKEKTTELDEICVELTVEPK